MGRSVDQVSEIFDTSARPHPLVEEFRAIISYRELLVQFVSRSLKTRYKRSFLGIFWTMLNPLLTMIVLTLVFSNLFRFSVPDYPIYILSGLYLWGFFSHATSFAMGEMLWSGSLSVPHIRSEIGFCNICSRHQPGQPFALTRATVPDRSISTCANNTSDLKLAVSYPDRGHVFTWSWFTAIHSCRLFCGYAASVRRFISHLDVCHPDHLPDRYHPRKIRVDHET